MTAPTCNRGTCPRQAHPTGRGLCEPHAYAAGTLRPFVDPARAAEHILELGVSPKAIATASGVSHQTIYNIRDGAYKKIRAHTADRILAVTPAHIPAVGFRAGWPVFRRLRALRAAGWTIAELTDETGLCADAITDLCSAQHVHVLAETDRTVRETYDRLGAAVKRPPSPLVEKRGWSLPMEWDDIDNPAENHDRGNNHLVRAAIDELHRAHGSWDRTARAIGMSSSRVRKIMFDPAANVPDATARRIRWAARHRKQLSA